MIVLYQILAFAIVLGIIVFVHELGHFLAARLMKVRVEVFSFGIGKRLVGKKIGDTDFRLSLIPLGGFVRMAGEEEYDPDNLKPHEFQSKNRAQKIFILFMGPAMNILLSFLILTSINIGGVESEQYKSEPPRIGYVEKDSPAEQAGIKKGDLILEINKKRISDWKELEVTIGASPNEKLDVVMQRNGKKYHTLLEVGTRSQYGIGYAGFFWDHKTEIRSINENSPAQKAGLKRGDVILAINQRGLNYFEIGKVIAGNPGNPLVFTVQRDKNINEIGITPERIQNRGMIGVEMTPHSPVITVHYGIFQAMKNSIGELSNLTFLTFNAFKKMLIGKLSPKNLSGPIEIAKFSQKAMESGLSNFFILIAFISLQLGIINLFPIPALDGGHLMIYSIEAIIRKELSLKVKSILINIGFFILIGLMIFVILNDVAKVLPNGWRSFIPF
jgi:regulator of sigma E protease